MRVDCLTIPQHPEGAELPSRIIARGLDNPRGMRAQRDGSVWLVEAGTGAAEQPFTGRVSKLVPDGGSAGFRVERVAEGFRSMNLQFRMYRDEILGVSDIQEGGDHCLVSCTDYVEGSTIIELRSRKPWFHLRGNINAMCYCPPRGSWLAVKPDTNHLVEFVPGDSGEQILTELPRLAEGQEAVPAALIYDAAQHAVHIALFSGELDRNPERRGIDFADRAGQVVQYNLESGELTTTVSGLNFPTGLALTSEGGLLVLELCRDVLEPLVPDCGDEPLHGGFRRFSGRLLHCDPRSNTVRVLASGLDTPSNLCVYGDSLLISEGMGIPRRSIPHPHNDVVELTGYIRQVMLE